MRKFFVLIFTVIILLSTTPIEVYAATTDAQIVSSPEITNFDALQADIATINVKDHSTLVNSSLETYTVDVDALQKAVDSIANNGTIFFANGIFNMNKHLSIPQNINVIGKETLIHGVTTDYVFGAYRVSNFSIKGLNFENCKYILSATSSSNFSVENISLTSNSYGILLQDCTQFAISDVLINQVRTSSYSCTDGIHLMGKNSYGTLTRIYGTTDDDFIALNADEGGKHAGSIHDITIDNCGSLGGLGGGKLGNGADSVFCGLRVYSTGSLITNILVKNCNLKNDNQECIRFTNAVGSVGDSGNGLLSVGKITFENCVFESLVDKEIMRFVYCNIDEIIIKDCTLIRNVRNVKTNINNFMTIGDSATIKKMSTDNLKLVNNSGQKVNLFYVAKSSSINNAKIANCDSTIKNYFADWNIRQSVLGFCYINVADSV